MRSQKYFEYKDLYTELSKITVELECLGTSVSKNDINKVFKNINIMDHTKINKLCRKINYLTDPLSYENVDASLENLFNFWNQGKELLTELHSITNKGQQIIEELERSVDHSDQLAEAPSKVIHIDNNGNTYVSERPNTDIVEDSNGNVILYDANDYPYINHIEVSSFNKVVIDSNDNSYILPIKNIVNIKWMNYMKMLSERHHSEITFVYNDMVSGGILRKYNIFGSSLPNVTYDPVTHSFTSFKPTSQIIDPNHISNLGILTINKLKILKDYLSNYEQSMVNYFSEVDGIKHGIISLQDMNKRNLRNRNSIANTIIADLIKTVNKRTTYYKNLGKHYYNGINANSWLN